MFGSSFSRYHGVSGTSNQYYNSRHVSCAAFSDAKLCTKFMKLIKENDVKTVRKMIKKGFDLNGVYRFEGEMEKMTAVHYVAKEGMVQMLKELLSSECDVNLATAFDMASPLHFACQLADNDVALTIAEDLIHAGADVNILDHAQRSPLIIASEKGNLLLVRLLLEFGAEVDHQYQEEEFPSGIYHALKVATHTPPIEEELLDAYKGNTALIQACRAHHLPVVKELINRGACLEMTNYMGNTPLHIACQSHCKDVFSDRVMRTPVAGHSAIVKLLIERGSDLNVRNKYTSTPLKRAIDGILSLANWTYATDDKIDETFRLFDIIQILLHSGCDARGLYEELTYHDLAEPPYVALKTPLHYLLKAGHAILSYDSARMLHQWRVCLRLLLAGGCSIQQEDIEHARELHVTPDILEEIQAACQQPLSLKKLCNVVVRRSIHKPLKASVCHLPLPQILKKLVSLEVID